MDDVKKYNCVKYIETKTADQFLRYIDPSHRRWGGITELNSRWIFRGHGNASWALVPKGWRNDPRKSSPLYEEATEQWETHFRHRPAYKVFSKSRIVDGLIMTAVIYEITYRFVQLCDEQGFFVPVEKVHSGSAYLRDYCHGWPDYESGYPLLSFALAQHHGVPTNLLDWTRNAEYAAFFAADDNFDPMSDKKNPDIAVWALNSKLLNPREVNSLHVLKCPRSENNFLHSQDGLFVWYPGANHHYLKYGNWPDFLDVLETRFAKARQKPIQKITLPANEVSILLHKLFRKRISKARLMPTYDNIFETIYKNLQVEAANRDLTTSGGAAV